MATARAYLGAWKEATLSFLDHLLVVCLAVGLPALMAGVASHNLLAADPDFAPWLLLRVSVELLITPLALAAALRMSREESFFRPMLGEIIGELLGSGRRLLGVSLLLVVLLRPAMLFVIGLPLVWLALWLLQPVRWLEGGPLWKGGGGGGGWRVLLASAPLWLAAPAILFASVFLEVDISRDSTALMMGLEQVVRALLMTWGWAVLMRLYRVHDPTFA